MNEEETFLDWIRDECSRRPEWFYPDMPDNIISLAREFWRQNHSGLSAKLCMQLFDRAINNKPLTAITEDDVFDKNNLKEAPGVKRETCRRYPSLKRIVYENGRVQYTDSGRAAFNDLRSPGNPGSLFYNSLAIQIVDQMFPIRLPYMPPQEPYIVRGIQICKYELFVSSICKPDRTPIFVERDFIGGELWAPIHNKE